MIIKKVNKIERILLKQKKDNENTKQIKDFYKKENN